MITVLLRRFLLVLTILGMTGFAFFSSKDVANRVLNGDAKGLPLPEAEGSYADAWLFNQRGYSGSVPPGAMENAWHASMQAVAPQSELPNTPTPDHWTSIGPAPINGGQIETPTPRAVQRGIVENAADPNPNLAATHWCAAADTGGIWETRDGGSSWAPRTDGELSLAMSTITIAPSNPQILFASTRDTSGSLLKSINGGASWTQQAPNLFANGGYFYFAAVKVHPSDPNTVLTMTWDGYNQRHGGVYKSVNGGASFC